MRADHKTFSGNVESDPAPADRAPGRGQPLLLNHRSRRLRGSLLGGTLARGRGAGGLLRRVARQRLGITPDEIDGGHTPALSRPAELAERLDAYAAEQGMSGSSA